MFIDQPFVRLSPDEMADKMMTKEREKFTASIENLFGDSFKYKDLFSNDPELESLGTPSFDHYKHQKVRFVHIVIIC